MSVQSSSTQSHSHGSGPSKGWRGRIVWRLAALACTIGLSVTVVWSLTGASYYWPGWVWLGLVIPFALVGSIRWAIRARTPTRLSVHLAVAAVVEAICVYAWLMAGPGYPWPLWPLLGLVISLAAHALIWPPGAGVREKELEERVGALTSSRRSVLEIQAMELRRVERDLHDGAQARLVSLGMNLGLAEQLMETDPDQAKGLLADARGYAGEALSDLRNLVRGIHPPVLADRGLEDAIRALVVTVPIPVEVTMHVPRGTLPDPVESALYFAVAESIANVVKHSGANKAWIRAEQTAGTFSVVIGDDGCGGADVNRGSGLAGIVRRLAAFDGTLSVVSPQGGPTILRMDIPCERSSPKTKPY
jgi:signal transduction histidine kinase